MFIQSALGLATDSPSCLSATPLKDGVRGSQFIVFLSAVFLASNAFATVPEIMLHENDVAEKGDFLATFHSNYTLRGVKDSGDSTWPEHHQTNLMAEFATGITPGWEVGIHLPFRRAGIDSQFSRYGAWGSSGVMFRLKHITNEKNGFFYGFNAEYDLSARRFNTVGREVEFRGIVGYDTNDYRITLNPTLNLGLGNVAESHKPDFHLDSKALYKASDRNAFGIEAYTVWGKVDDLRPGAVNRIVYFVAEAKVTSESNVSFGIGQGLKDMPEKRVLKFVWSARF